LEKEMPLEIIDQYPFEFYGEVFELYLTDNLQPYVPVRAMCEALGIDPSAQLRRIKRDLAIADALVVLTPKDGDAWGGARQISCLWLKRLPYWLGTLSASRIKSEHQDKIVRFKREFAEVAWGAFRSAIFPEDILAELDSAPSPAEQEYQQLMDEAAALRQQIREQGEKIDDVVTRVAGLEARFLGTEFINADQASQLRRMVAVLVSKIETNKGKQSPVFQRVHAELKRQFNVPSYLLIAEKEYPKVAKFLADWYRRVAHDEPPQVFLMDQRKLF
jgi:hypothetical protein